MDKEKNITIKGKPYKLMTDGSGHYEEDVPATETVEQGKARRRANRADMPEAMVRALLDVVCDAHYDAEVKLIEAEKKIKKLEDMRCDFDCGHCHEGDEGE